MRLTIVQSSLIWENIEANLNGFDQKLAGLAGKTDVVVLPEMFSTGFSMSPEKLAEPKNGKTMKWLQAKSTQLDAVVTGSFICGEKGSFFNRLVWAQPDGQCFFYDKKHLFGLAGEKGVYAPGKKRLLINWRGLTVCPMICYDLRFPAWSRNQSLDPYDLLIYVANWPKKRVAHWSALLQARAIENQSWAAGVNIVGTDGNGHEYSGESVIFDHSGQKICQISGEEGLFTTEIMKADIEKYRAALPFLADRDAFWVA